MSSDKKLSNEDLFNLIFNSKPDTPLQKMMDYIHGTDPLKADVERIEEFLLRNTHTGHPDDQCQITECALGDIEVYLLNAKDKQEQEDDEWEAAMNNPDHPRHEEFRTRFENGGE